MSGTCILALMWQSIKLGYILVTNSLLNTPKIVNMCYLTYTSEKKPNLHSQLADTWLISVMDTLHTHKYNKTIPDLVETCRKFLQVKLSFWLAFSTSIYKNAVKIQSGCTLGPSLSKQCRATSFIQQGYTVTTVFTRCSTTKLPYTQVHKRIRLFSKLQGNMRLIPNMRLIAKGKIDHTSKTTMPSLVPRVHDSSFSVSTWCSPWNLQRV